MYLRKIMAGSDDEWQYYKPVERRNGCNVFERYLESAGNNDRLLSVRCVLLRIAIADLGNLARVAKCTTQARIEHGHGCVNW